MPDPEKVATVVSEWVAKAENDLKTAAYTLRLGKGCPTDTVCFHGQQVVEKYLKALLTAHGIAFPKTHNVRKLVEMLPGGTRLNLSEDEQDELTDYATGARYPGWGEISLTDSRRVVAVARRLRRDVRKLLPKGALRRRKR
jgi:HEPN domain-containing protein